MKGNVRIINLAEAKVQPDIKEVRNSKGKEFVLFGEKNDYYKNLIELYLSSPTNARCINGISDMIYGKGLEATNNKERPRDYMEMKRLINGHELRRVVTDLKQLGEGMAQVIWNKGKTKIMQFVHTPRECWRAEKTTDGVIGGYYYHPKWEDYKINDKLKRLPTFGNGAKDELVELYVFRPYRPGFYYYSPVDYQGCLQYAELEEEVSNYHINNIQNGLQPSMIINFNNGRPNEETMELIERRIMDKFSGTTNAGRFILAFNDDADSAATVEPIQLIDAHAQYQFLADEAREKIMLGHGVVSPILLGIKDNTGFGNNAEELRTASILMDNMVIRPFQDIIIDGLNEILAKNQCFLNLYFVTLQPIEFAAVDKIATKIKREEETGEKLSADEVELTDFTDDEGEEMLRRLQGLGEVIDESKWELIHSEAVDDSDPSFSALEKLYEANPNSDSTQDQDIYKIRYAYLPIRNSENSRTFCKSMEVFTRNNTVFRKEDINMMSFRGVNRSLGHKRRNYSLFKYKGGKNCKHFWEMRVYRQVVGEGNRVSKSNVDDPGNPKEVPVRPFDMPGHGAHPSTLN